MATTALLDIDLLRNQVCSVLREQGYQIEESALVRPISYQQMDKKNRCAGCTRPRLLIVFNVLGRPWSAMKPVYCSTLRHRQRLTRCRSNLVWFP